MSEAIFHATFPRLRVGLLKKRNFKRRIRGLDALEAIVQTLCENLFDDMSVNVGKTTVDTVLAVNQALMIDT